VEWLLSHRALSRLIVRRAFGSLLQMAMHQGLPERLCVATGDQEPEVSSHDTSVFPTTQFTYSLATSLLTGSCRCGVRFVDLHGFSQ